MISTQTTLGRGPGRREVGLHGYGAKDPSHKRNGFRTLRTMAVSHSQDHDPTSSERRRQSTLARKTAVGLAGTGLIAAGVVMLVTPGPGLLTIAGGLTVLAREFAFADRAVRKIRTETIDKIRRDRAESPATAASEADKRTEAA